MEKAASKVRDGKVVTFAPRDWERVSGLAHLIAFKESRPNEANTFDYVLAYASHQELFAYATIIEMDNQTAYMQHGGAMPNVKGTTSTRKAYHDMIEWLKSKYARISTRISNNNIGMLKLAMNEGLRIQGCDMYKGEVFLHVAWGFDV